MVPAALWAHPNRIVPVGLFTDVLIVHIPHAPIRTGGNPGLNLSSEGHSADQGERHQNGGKEAEETMGDLRFHNRITFQLFCFVELFWKSYVGMIAGKLLTTLVSPLFPLTNFVLLAL